MLEVFSPRPLPPLLPLVMPRLTTSTATTVHSVYPPPSVKTSLATNTLAIASLLDDQSDNPQPFNEQFVHEQFADIAPPSMTARGMPAAAMPGSFLPSLNVVAPNTITDNIPAPRMQTAGTATPGVATPNEATPDTSGTITINVQPHDTLTSLKKICTLCSKRKIKCHVIEFTSPKVCELCQKKGLDCVFEARKEYPARATMRS